MKILKYKHIVKLSIVSERYDKDLSSNLNMKRNWEDNEIEFRAKRTK